ncbi:MAG: sigma-54-dependent Fis family transcriptional regulator [Deltaproteobacteria bacterium]|nr:sigma-54-dependent Fis family transcriptional regulator [Deltaproteobacteria bacterium]
MSTVLIIDDDETMREGCAAVARRMGHKVLTAAGGREGIDIFVERGADFVVSDMKMQGVDGLEVVRGIREHTPDALIMIITAYAEVTTAVEAMRRGAWDFITKPFNPDVLRQKIEKALEVARLRREQEVLVERNRVLSEEIKDSAGVKTLIGSSKPMTEVMSLLAKVAVTDSSVLITGESGTGKELVARAIHDLSNRSKGPFIKVSCGALAETLLESELFGHEKGSFTGAIRRKLGRFELAHGGTLFLDEIGDISQSIQLKLLRVLQEHEFERVGGEETIRVDVRCISATNKNLQEEVGKGRFREDLFYRLHIIPVRIPPLRMRKEDIPVLVAHFIEKLGPRTGGKVKTICPEAIDRLAAYDWPGNVRELENAIEQTMVFCEEEVIGLRDLPQSVTGAPIAVRRGVGGEITDVHIPDGDIPLDPMLEDIERKLIQAAYDRADGVKAECARILGIKTSALYYKLEKYKIGGKE